MNLSRAGQARDFEPRRWSVTLGVGLLGTIALLATALVAAGVITLSRTKSGPRLEAVDASGAMPVASSAPVREPDPTPSSAIAASVSAPVPASSPATAVVSSAEQNVARAAASSSRATPKGTARPAASSPRQSETPAEAVAPSVNPLHL